MSDKSVLVQEFDKQVDKHTKAQLLAKIEKLLQYDSSDTGSTAFKLDFKECQMIYKELRKE